MDIYKAVGATEGKNPLHTEGELVIAQDPLAVAIEQLDEIVAGKEPDVREVIRGPEKAGTEAEVLEVERRRLVVAKDRAVDGYLRFKTRSDRGRPAHAGVRDEESVGNLGVPGQRDIVRVKNRCVPGYHEPLNPRRALQNHRLAKAVV